MGSFEKLKSIWKKLGINGHVKNFSSKQIWILVVIDGVATAHLLRSKFKSPPNIDADAFRRVDGQKIDGHGSWWKIYDLSTAEIFEDKKGEIKVSAITKTAAKDIEFADGKNIIYNEKTWGVPIRQITEVLRDKKRRIVSYHVSGLGWLPCEEILALTCKHEIDNARPVFPQSGSPYVRTRRDPEFFNNIDAMGIV